MGCSRMRGFAATPANGRRRHCRSASAISSSDASTATKGGRNWKPGVVRTMYDPTGGTGGMLSVAAEYLAELNPKARLTLFGQELNPES